MSIRRWSRSASTRRDRGQALVEFALVIPLFLLMMLALFDLGRAVFAYNTLTNAAREGARLAIVNQDLTSIIERAKRQTAIVELDAPNVEVHFYRAAEDGTPDTSDPCALVAVNCLAVVRFEATYRPHHAVDQQHPLRKRGHVHRHIGSERRVHVSERRLPDCKPVSQAAMNSISTIFAKPEVTMIGVHRQSARRNRGQQGQIIVIAALAMVALIGGVSLILEGGNAYAHQRVAQNAADAVANAGATVLAKRLGGDTSRATPVCWLRPTRSRRPIGSTRTSATTRT